jgi:hypothetical protein
MKKRRLKIERGYCEIYTLRLSLQEYNIKFDGLYGAYSFNENVPLKKSNPVIV